MRALWVALLSHNEGLQRWHRALARINVYNDANYFLKIRGIKSSCIRFIIKRY
jgi:hypothetical protein